MADENDFHLRGIRTSVRWLRQIHRIRLRCTFCDSFFPLAFASEREAAHPENSRQIQRVKAIRQNDELCMILPLSQLYLDGCQSITSLLICCHLFCLGAQTCIGNSYSNEAVKNHKKQAKRRNHATLPRLAVGGNCARANAV